MGKIIITGANGFIGYNLTKEFSKRGFEVYALDFKFSNSELMSLDNVHLITCDLMNDDSFDCLNLYDIDVIIHLAWAGTSGTLRSDINVQLNNVKMACNCIHLATKINCKRILYASSINEVETYEYLMADNVQPSLGYIYGTGKLAAHLMAETLSYQNNIEFIPILITNIYGAGENSARLINSSIRKLLKGEHCSFTEGKQMYDFIYIDDAINSIIEVSLRGKAFNCYYIGSGKPRPLCEFLTEMKDIVAPTAVLGFGDLPFRGIDIDYNQFNLKKVEEDTGYVNKFDFKEGIFKTLRYIKGVEND